MWRINHRKNNVNLNPNHYEQAVRASENAKDSRRKVMITIRWVPQRLNNDKALQRSLFAL